MENVIFEKEFLGRGLHFPIGIDPVTGRIRTSAYEDSIRESIYLILMTRKGERVMQPDFGCGIQDYVFESMDYGIMSKMSTSVKNALIMWEPRIDEVEVDVAPSASETGMIEIRISYVVRSTNNPYNLVYPFYLNEGLVTLDSAQNQDTKSNDNKEIADNDGNAEKNEHTDNAEKAEINEQDNGEHAGNDDGSIKEADSKVKEETSAESKDSNKDEK